MFFLFSLNNPIYNLFIISASLCEGSAEQVLLKQLLL